MKHTLKPAFALAACIIVFVAFAFRSKNSIPKADTPKSKTIVVQPKIQAAILLDVSGSMSGLIDQAKVQLWNMVSVMGKAKCANDAAPEIEIALYEYGNNEGVNFIRQVSPFTTDLDKLSQDLFSLSITGSEEYCGQVIYNSLNELKWDTAPANYKVIFIAGNEDFLQGRLHYTKACALAKKNGVIVNTIYCGDRMDGIREHWNLSAECGNGSFTNINHNEKMEDIPTPYDSIMFSLNDKLNSTYIGYGSAGRSKMQVQSEMDKKNYSLNKASAAKRAEVKGKSSLYKNDSWDLVDATTTAKSDEVINKVDMATLPDSLQKKTRAQLKEIVTQKSKERTALQAQMTEISTKRNIYLAEEKKKIAVKNNSVTLETAMEKIIKTQAKLFGMTIE